MPSPLASGAMADAEPAKRKSDLGVRAASAVVMLAVAGTALWLGGIVWTVFVGLIALGVLWEWVRLVHAITPHPVTRGLWNSGGLAYLGVAAAVLIALRLYEDGNGLTRVLLLIGAVIATDVGAYFAGRTFGGPKIAPKISPSKTWSGLVGGMLGASVVLAGSLVHGLHHLDSPSYEDVPDFMMVLMGIAAGVITAIVAQSGDFFESWMKRRAGVKDSSHLIPGHGGLFDRVDGLLSVCFVTGLFFLTMARVGGA